MKKYLKLISVLGAFFILVFLKNYKGDAEGPVGLQQTSLPTVSQPSPSATTIPTATSVPVRSGSTPPPATPTSTPTPVVLNNSKYKDGSYSGSVEDAYYGNMQVQVIVTGGKITDVKPLSYPNDNRTSLRINTIAFPMLRDEVIAAQSAQIDLVSGASESSPAFVRSLTNALAQAKR